MASDFKITWNVDLMEGAFNIVHSDIETDDGMDTAVIISLFSDRRAKSDDAYDNNDKRGWWADLTTVDGDEIGSRLYLLDRAKTDRETINSAIEYAEESLQWMISDGVASRIDVSAERAGVNGDRLYLFIDIYKTDGNLNSYKYEGIWTAQFS